MFRTNIVFSPMLSKATRLQLGNVKTEYGLASTAAGSKEKWGSNLGPRSSYPFATIGMLIATVSVAIATVGTYQQYRDMTIMTEHISYEDVKDRCLTPIPGWARIRSMQMANPTGPQTFRDPTPLDWLPFDVKLGYVKQASY